MIKPIFVLLVVLFTAVSAHGQQKQAIKEKVTQINQELFDALIDGSVDKITSLYTTDGTLFPPSGEMIKGKSAIREYWLGSINSSQTLKVETQNIDFELYSDNTAYESGSYDLDFKLPNEQKIQTAKGIYLIIWKKVEDTWKIHVDMWN